MSGTVPADIIPQRRAVRANKAVLERFQELLREA